MKTPTCVCCALVRNGCLLLLLAVLPPACRNRPSPPPALPNNVLVNDPAQDHGNEQNSQFESSVVVIDGQVVVAYVDSNLGVYAYGQDRRLGGIPRFLGHAVSRDGGGSFSDQGAPPVGGVPVVPRDADGDAGDPVLAVDRAAGLVYLVGNPPRNAGHRGLVLWTSRDRGVTFERAGRVREDLRAADKPWIAVDNASGAGQRDVYLVCSSIFAPLGLWMTVARDGNLGAWSPPAALRQVDGSNVRAAQSAIVVTGPAHDVCVAWLEQTGNNEQWLRMREVLGRGASLGPVQDVVRLGVTNLIAGLLPLRRDNAADASDTFRAFAFPVVAANPNAARRGHLYVAYADVGEAAGDRADVFLVRSTDGGKHWTSRVRISTLAKNDQWMPALAVKPDGTLLCATWYDRRNDSANGQAQLFGRWGRIGANGAVTWATEFVVSSSSFPAVFTGTRPANQAPGHYDPVYPPGDVNLNWHYAEWPADPEEVTFSPYIGHVGEYNGAWGEPAHVYLTWTDARLRSTGTRFARPQTDIRFSKLAWPD